MRTESASLSVDGDTGGENCDALLEDAANGLFAVADGVGNQPGTAAASRMAVRMLAREMLPCVTRKMLENVGVCELELESCLQRVNAALRSADGTGTGAMLTTMTVACVRGARLSFAHAGDSRLYLLRSGCMRCLTDDHTVVGDMLRRGLLTETEAHTHPRRGMMSSCLGLHQEARVQRGGSRLCPGDVLLLCTDGVWAYISESSIEGCFEADAAARDCVLRLVAEAGDNGSHDDRTAVVVTLGPKPR